ncbi:MAG TPA: hypothetical protein VGO67_08275 [Verrucomicrobiae bacterium]|jgi:hypothetical protein
MNENELRAKLIAAAKSNPPGDHAPYAFEKRVMNAIATRPVPDVWDLWAGPMWRAALSCVAVTVLCGVWSFAAHRQAPSDDNFSQDFEAMVFAPPGQQNGDAW